MFTQLPRREWSAVLNSASFLAGHIETCSAQNSLDPNVILVDFYGQGDVVDVVQAHNEGLAGPSPDPQAAMDTEQPSLQPTSQPTPSFLDPARKELYDLICLRLGSKEDCDNLLDTETARGQAFEWLFSNDALEFLTNEKKVQRYALATHYYSANGAAWTSNSGWLSNIDECLWATSAFLSCDGDGQYISLVLDSNNMEGSVPYEIGMLTTLTSVDLSNNALSGEIPTSLGRLTMLTSLDLSNNDFTGPIPTTLGLLSNLEVLTLRANSLTAIPTELGQLFSLQQMYVGENQLVGTISTELGNLQRLTALGLDKNKLTGTLPAEVSKLTLLQVMDLSSNNLSGLVSTGLRNFRDLSFLSLHNNLFIGPLPAELGELTGLRLLDLSVNNLFGTLPESLRQLELMDELLLNSNNLVGEVRVLTSLQRLKRLRIDDNDFSGVAPQELCDLFDQIQPVVFADCQEITVPCATYCCEDGNGCVCRFESTDPLRCLMM